MIIEVTYLSIDVANKAEENHQEVYPLREDRNASRCRDTGDAGHEGEQRSILRAHIEVKGQSDDELHLGDESSGSQVASVRNDTSSLLLLRGPPGRNCWYRSRIHPEGIAVTVSSRESWRLQSLRKCGGRNLLKGVERGVLSSHVEVQ